MEVDSLCWATNWVRHIDFWRTLPEASIINYRFSKQGVKPMSDQFSAEYSDSNFWEKVKKYARAAGEGVLEPALKMYYAALDQDTPAWAKATIVGALGYFISPIDAVPDLVPVVGYADDLGVLVAALATTSAHIKAEHVKKAKETLSQWFS
jgi:uncharacterized membrane protein YkvA (DUF1232 family)